MLTAESARTESNTPSAFDETIWQDSQLLGTQLQVLRERLFAPEANKELRRFTTGETAKLLGITHGYMRQLAASDDAPVPEKGPRGHNYYSLQQIHALRHYLAKGKPSYLPARKAGEHLQVIAVTNLKGGSGKTTTATHVAQFLALRGYRVLAIDLDPQASMSALFGYQPEFDVSENQTMYGAIRYDDGREPLRKIIRKTYFAGLDLVPGNLELHDFEHDTPKALLDTDRDPKGLFFMRVADAIASVEDDYDVVVVDCPPQLGFLTMSGLCAATSVLITVHPQMLDVASMNQFLAATSNMLGVVRRSGGDLSYDWMRYLVTRYEPNDGPQFQIVSFLRNLFSERVMTQMMVKSTAISDAGLSKQTIYEAPKESMNRQTYDRALEAMDGVNSEIERLIQQAWGRVSR